MQGRGAVSIEELEACLRFLRRAEGLKSVLRTAWTATGRHESTAEHSWRLALFAGILLPRYPALDAEKVLLMCLIHDIGELEEGDISAALRPDEEKKRRAERRAAENAFLLLPGGEARRLMALWEEYSQGVTPEARLVKALDKAETILQHNQGENPADFDYAFNLEYGARWFEDDGFLRDLRALLDAETRRHAEPPL